MKEKNLLEYKEERKKDKGTKANKVKCPCCTNKRLMDVLSADQAELEIKCPECRRVIRISFQHNQLHAKSV